MFDIVIHRFEIFKRFFKKNAIFYVLSTCISVVFLVILGVLYVIQSYAIMEESHVKGVYKDKKLYTIIDNFIDEDSFYEFRQHSENINRLGQFYNAFIRSSNMKMISVFNQPINIKQFKGGEKFLYNSQEFRDKFRNTNKNVKSVQLNSTAFELYQLSVRHGNNFNWYKMDYNKNTIPILLGSNYEGVYEIGNTFVGDYYGRDVTFEVIGILKPNTFIYFKGDPELYLDTYVVIPYPKYCKAVNEKNFNFEGILYFAMINGDIVTKIEKKTFLKEVKYISDTTGFKDFSIVGIPDFTLKHDTMISVIQENLKLLIITILLLSVLVIFIQYGMACLILTKRIDVYSTYWLMGYNKYELVYFRDISIPYIISLVLSVIIIGLCFHLFSFALMLFLLVVSAIILGLAYLISMHNLKEVMKNLL